MVRFAAFACLMVVGSAYANERSAELVKSFQTLCASAPLDFTALDAKATAMKLVVRKDVVAPQQTGKSARTKSWLVPLGGRSYELIATEARGPDTEAQSCGIGADDVDGEEIRRDLVEAMKLDAPLRQNATADGAQRVTTWKYADDATLLLADGTPMKIPGVYLTLQQQKTTSH
jgi:hypothetical protein